MSTTKGALGDRLDHEICCLSAIELGLQGLACSPIHGGERDFAHLVQDRIDRLREIQKDIESLDVAPPRARGAQ